MDTETDMETETDTERETYNTRTWKWPRTWTWTWNWQTCAKYFIRRNCPHSAIWNASEISQRYILVAPLHYEENDEDF